jgi:hypothetical protein
MSAIRFLADEDLRRAIVVAVRRLEPALEFDRGQELGLGGRSDADVLEYASLNGYLLVSHDVTTMPVVFGARLKEGRATSGLLLAPQSKSTRAVAESLVLIWSASNMDEYTNRIVYLPI